MASPQAYLVDLIVRLTIKRRMKKSPSLAQVRAALDSPRQTLPKEARFTPGALGGVAGEWVGFDGVTPRAAMLYLHGGGYVACSPRSHRPITAAYARAGLRVFAPDYRLAPEHPYPAAIEDAVAAWTGLLATLGADEGVVTGGDSAGGGLALAMMLKLRDAHARPPDAAALFSPWTDLAVTGDSVRANTRRDAMFTGEGVRNGPAPYLQATDPRDPYASPLYADLRGLPPLLIHVGEREVLRDDSTRLAERARAAGVEAALTVWPVVPHVWQLAVHMLPEARRSMDQAAAFLLSRAATVRAAA